MAKQGRPATASFLLFAILPAAVLILMNALWGEGIRNMGCAGEPTGLARTATAGEIRPHQMGALFRRTLRVGPGCPDKEATPSRLRVEPSSATAPPVFAAIAQGRFEWMAFHLWALILFSAATAVASYCMWRNLKRWRFFITLACTLTAGVGWAFYSLGDPNALRFDTASLLSPTMNEALPHYDLAFQQTATGGVLLDYGFGLAVTALIVVAAASVMADVGFGQVPDAEELSKKRRDLKLIMFTASLFLTFVALYLGQWLAWPAHFAADAKTLGSYRGSAEEFRDVASGLRLYFGTGYTLALVAFAVPAVFALSAPVARRRKRSANATDAGGGDQAGRGEVGTEGEGSAAADAASHAVDDGHGGYFGQEVFSKTELAMLMSMLTPFLTTLAGAALRI
jgi:hypothetical protein